MIEEESLSNLNLFGDGSEELSDRLFDDSADGGALMGGITNLCTGFKLKMNFNVEYDDI